MTGGGFHDFVTQEGIVPPAIAKRANVVWTVDHTAGQSTRVLIPRHENTLWTKDVDVVLYNMSFSHVVDVPWIERLAAAHRDSGVGAVILHGAVHSYRRSESKAWGELMGAFSMRHDAQRPLTVEVVAPEHPSSGAPRPWVTIPEELYELERVWPGMTPLAQAHSVESGKTYPLMWTNTHGKAKVFVTSLGHNTEMIANPIIWTSSPRVCCGRSGACRTTARRHRDTADSERATPSTSSAVVLLSACRWARAQADSCRYVS